MHGFKVCQSELSILLNSHYAFPSPLAVSDVLDNLDIEHEVFYLTEENIGELEKVPLPLLCYEKDKNEYFLVQSIERDKDSFKLISSKKDIIEFYNDLLLIAVFIDKGTKSGQMLNKCKTLKIQKSILMVCFTLLLLISAYTYLENNGYFFVFRVSGLTIKIIGLLVTWLLIKLDVDTQSVSFLTRKICINNRYFNCQTVSQSARFRLFEKVGISIAEIGFIYFAVGLIYELFYVTGSIFSLAWPMAVANVCGIFVIIGLFIYQIVRIRKICILCLMTYSLLFLELAVYVIYGIFSTKPRWIDFVYFLLCSVFVLVIFFLLKLFSVHRSQYQNALTAHKRILNNPKLIDKILLTSKRVSYSIQDFDLIIGNKNTTYKILFVPDMRCYSCAEIIKSILNLINKHDNCAIIIRFFLFQKNLNQLDTSVIQVVYSIAQQHGSEKALNFLAGWLKIYPKNEEKLEKYACKQISYPVSLNINHQLSFYKQWSIENNFIRTPFIAINGQELPHLLSIEDLKYYFI